MRLTRVRPATAATTLRRLLATPVALVALTGVVALSASCSSDDGGSGATSTTSVGHGASSTIDPNATTTIGDLGDVTGPVSDCVRLAAKFSNLVQGLLGGADGAKRSQEAAEQLKSELPQALHHDADVVAATFGRIAANGGQIEGADVDDAAYKAATADFAAYFARNCTP